MEKITGFGIFEVQVRLKSFEKTNAHKTFALDVV